MLDETVISAVNAMVAAVLVNSGLTKLVAPTGLRRALRELAPALGGGITDGFVRAVVGLELVTAAGLLVSVTRTSAAVAVAFLAMAFAALGAAGAMRGTTTACGCFGRASDKPLGITNVLIGLALLPVVPLNALGTAGSVEYSANSLVFAAVGSFLLCLWLNRRLAAELLFRRTKRA